MSSEPSRTLENKGNEWERVNVLPLSELPENNLAILMEVFSATLRLCGRSFLVLANYNFYLTCVFISGVFFSGPPYRILKLWRDGKFEIVISQEILEEYQRVGEELSIQ